MGILTGRTGPKPSRYNTIQLKKTRFEMSKPDQKKSCQSLCSPYHPNAPWGLKAVNSSGNVMAKTKLDTIPTWAIVLQSKGEYVQRRDWLEEPTNSCGVWHTEVPDVERECFGTIMESNKRALNENSPHIYLSKPSAVRNRVCANLYVKGTG